MRHKTLLTALVFFCALAAAQPARAQTALPDPQPGVPVPESGGTYPGAYILPQYLTPHAAPGSYDMRAAGKVPAIRTQGATKASWAYAAFDTMETWLMPRTDEPHFSVTNLCTSYAFTPVGTQLDASAYVDYSPKMTAAYLGRQRNILTYTGAYSGYYLRDICFLRDKTSYSDYDQIKSVLISTGSAVSTTFFWNSASNYYNSSTHSYYYSASALPNAAVSIIGWDDAYSRFNFSAPSYPPGNGAFLARAVTSNSPSSTFGTEQFDNGYFWISYYDANVGKNTSVLSGVAKARYADGNYTITHSTHGWVSNFSGNPCSGSLTCWASNYFVNNSGRSLRLTSVSFYTTENNAAYNMIITTSPPAAKNPLGTTTILPFATQQLGSFATAGFHTVMISTAPEMVTIADGQAFSVVVGITNPSVTYPLAFSYPLVGYSASMTPHTGVSFVKDKGSIGDWCDTGATGAGYCPGGGNAGYVPIYVSYINRPDNTSPSPNGRVRNGLDPASDKTKTNDNTKLSFTWPAFTDDESGVETYLLAIGTSTAASEALSWQDLKSDATYYTKLYLTLAYGTTYYAHIKARNAEGLISADTGTLSGILVEAPPEQPTGLSGSALSVSSVCWNWSRSERNNGYRIYASDNDSLLGTTALNTETWTHVGLSSPNAPSGIYIKAIGTAGDKDSIPSIATATYTLATVPGTPSGEGTGRTACTVTWTANSNALGTQYQVQYSSMATFVPDMLSNYYASQSLALSGLKENTTYYVRVRARNGNNIATAFTATGTCMTWPPPPTPIYVSSSSVLGANSIMWLWDDVQNESSYQVYSYPANKVLASLSAGATSWAETGLAPNTSYTRYIKANNQSGSSISDYIVAVTSASAPTGFGISASGRSAIIASWSAGTNPSGTTYRLELSTSASFPSNAVIVSTVAALTKTATGLSAGQTYYGRVFGINSLNALSLPSSTQQQALSAPPNITAISPATSDNLKTSAVFSITGTSFLDGDFVLARKTGMAERQATTTLISSSTAATAYFNTLGMEAGSWTVLLADAQGVESSVTATLTITDNAQSGSQNSTKTQSGSSRATVTTVGGHAQAAIPAGITALTNATVYSSSSPQTSPLLASPSQIQAATKALPSGTALLDSSPAEIVAYAGGSQVSGVFNAPVPFYIKYPDADNNGVVDGTAFSEASLYMVVLDTQTSTWTKVPNSAVVQAGKYVQSPLYHFSVYALLGTPPASDLSDAKIYPNPWKPASGGTHDRATLRIGGLPTQTEAYIYNVAGELVIHLPLTNSTYYDWDGRNGSGETVASGVYFARLKTSSQSKILKFAIQR